ncbi:ABC transporter permease [Ligilactobacillus ruminis]|uniref:Peptide ABC superfamily ATP binding cassette transporter permease n=1 Tax=Ligilactobacillus ruminis SPM0211 TaxID=1040964 RepID=F7R141_9LACO|nr:ABC transporter permease [Ligilactobacillus ruminis]EGM51091.1 peptide ABC superfamily ATP binding cassette transporter permease [Ligilactobacillus ruminis SPM0211]HCI89876.1 ABC transporter permease [Lactobacillus sp.]
MLKLKLSRQTISKNLQLYLPFLLANAVLVGINYIFFSMTTNKSLEKQNYGSVLIQLMNIGLVFTLAITFFFMIYINSIVSRRRNHELGLYSILGMTRSDLGKMIFFIDAIMFVASSVLGLVFGATFVKFVGLGLKKLLDMGRFDIPVFSSVAAIICVGYFAAVYFILLLGDLWRLRSVNPLDLWKAANKREKEPRGSWIFGIVGVIALGSGYAIAVRMKASMDAVTSFMLAVILVVIGTYLVFIAFSIIFLKMLRKNKNFYYKRNHFISVSGMIYRMKQNGASLASICLLLTTALVAIVTTGTLRLSQEATVRLYNPYDVVMTKKTPISYADKMTIQSKARDNHVTVGKYVNMTMTEPIYGNFSGSAYSVSKTVDMSTENQLFAVPVADYNRIQKQNVHLAKDEILMCSSKGGYDKNRLTIKGKTYKVRHIDSFDFYFDYQRTIFKPIFVFAKDRKVCEQISGKWLYAMGYDISGKKSDLKRYAAGLGDKFTAVVKKNSQEPYMDSFTDRPSVSDLFNQLFGGLLFIGIFVSIVMLIATVVVMYYKQVSEGYADRDRFKTMQQVGLSREETKSAINSQVLTVFMLPIIGAAVNVGFAIPAIQKMLVLLSMYDKLLLVKFGIVSLAVTFLGYVAVYKLTTNVYENIVNR